MSGLEGSLHDSPSCLEDWMGGWIHEWKSVWTDAVEN